MASTATSAKQPSWDQSSVTAHKFLDELENYLSDANPAYSTYPVSYTHLTLPTKA